MTVLTNKREEPLALVVDDDLSLRLSMCAALNKVGFKTIEAQNGREAVNCFRAEQPDLVLLDVMMPEMDGFETCSAIRLQPGGKYVQILMVTGLDDTDSIERAFEAGANDFITKPLNLIMLGHRGKYMLRAGRAIKELSRSQHRLAATQELAKLGNWEVDLQTNKFYCSPEASRILGQKDDSSQVGYQLFWQSVIAKDYSTIKDQIENAFLHHRALNLNYRITLPNGSQRHILNHSEILYSENGEAVTMLGAIQDVTQLKNAEEEIRLLAFYDGLTGLANRMLFMERLKHEIASSKRQGKCFALLFLDLDQFKRVNDSFGHHVGDLLLKNVAETLRNLLRASDAITGPASSESNSLIARLGGDEFIILLSDIRTPENAAVAARKILHSMPSQHELEEHKISITTSIGISVYPGDGEDVETLLKRADSAMYHAKETGRNKYQFYKESLNAAVLNRLTLEQEIHSALKENQFQLYYQPQLDLATRKVVGAEALMRWLHPQKGFISPDRFIPIAEESGLIVDINKWVIQTACRQNKKWIEAGFDPLRIAVNLSAYKFTDQNIIAVIRDALLEADLEAKHLEVEITENVFIQNAQETVKIMEQIKDLKIRIALDDFGTGYSSLSYLVSFPVDIIKIDRSFIMGSTVLQNNREIIKAIIAMGHSLGMKIVAEGIETEEQYEFLKEHGADLGQGYYFSPAVQQDDFTKFLMHSK